MLSLALGGSHSQVKVHQECTKNPHFSNTRQTAASPLIDGWMPDEDGREYTSDNIG
jgi:hypothetical protein